MEEVYNKEYLDLCLHDFYISFHDFCINIWLHHELWLLYKSCYFYEWYSHVLQMVIPELYMYVEFLMDADHLGSLFNILKFGYFIFWIIWISNNNNYTQKVFAYIFVLVIFTQEQSFFFFFGPSQWTTVAVVLGPVLGGWKSRVHGCWWCSLYQPCLGFGGTHSCLLLLGLGGQ